MAELYIILAGALVAAMLAYLLRGGMTLSTGAGWVILACIHGLFVKPLFVYLNFPSADVLDIVLFRKVSRDDFWLWGTFALLGYAVFFVSMAWAGGYRSHIVPRADGRVRYFNNASLVLFMVPVIVGIAGFLIQFPQVLISASKNSLAGFDLEDYNGGGIWRAMIDLAYPLSLCALVNVGARVARRSSTLLFGWSSGLWLAFCYVSDQRGAMLFSIVTYLIAYHRYVAKLTRVRIAAAVAITIGLVVVKTVTRLQGGGVALQELLADTLGNFIGQNLIENGKTITIIQSIPGTLPFQWGYTYVNAIVMLVPRVLFPGKTAVNLDTTIGNTMFDCGAYGACGMPPGLLAESYLNFGQFGLLVMPILAGVLIGRLDAMFREVARGGPFDIFYLVSLLYLGMAFLGAGLSSSITSIATQSISIGTICFLCARTTVGSRALRARRAILLPAGERSA